MSDDSAFAVAEVCQGIRPACSGNSKGQAEFLSRQKQPVGLQEKSLLTPLKPRVFMDWGRRARRDGQQPKCFQGSASGLGESEGLLVAQGKACDACLALITGFGYSCGRDIPSATFAGF